MFWDSFVWSSKHRHLWGFFSINSACYLPSKLHNHCLRNDTNCVCMRDRQAPRCQLNTQSHTFTHSHIQSHTSHTHAEAFEGHSSPHMVNGTTHLQPKYKPVPKSVSWLVLGPQIKPNSSCKDVLRFFRLIKQTQTPFVFSIKSAGYLSSKLRNHCLRNDTVSN